MDTNSIIFAVFGIVIGALGFFLKRVVTRMDDMEDDFQEHKVQDAAKWSEFAAHKDEVMRRLENIEEKLDRLLEK